MNKTKNEESMLETTRNDISMNTDIIQTQNVTTAGTEEVVDYPAQKIEKPPLKISDSPTANREKSIEIEEIKSPGGMSQRAGSQGSNFDLTERHALNRTTLNSKTDS